MSVFYKCYKKTHEVNDPAAPVYRAVEIPQDKQKYDYVINVLCSGVLDQIDEDLLLGIITLWQCCIVEEPFEKMPN